MCVSFCSQGSEVSVWRHFLSGCLATCSFQRSLSGGSLSWDPSGSVWGSLCLGVFVSGPLSVVGVSVCWDNWNAAFLFVLRRQNEFNMCIPFQEIIRKNLFHFPNRSFLKEFFWTYVHLWGHWYPCFGLLVTSPLGQSGFWLIRTLWMYTWYMSWHLCRHLHFSRWPPGWPPIPCTYSKLAP